MINKDELIKDYMSGAKVVQHMFVTHVKTGNYYVVTELVKDATNSRDGNVLVIYREIGSDVLWARDIEEFCDGRFEKED